MKPGLESSKEKINKYQLKIVASRLKKEGKTSKEQLPIKKTHSLIYNCSFQKQCTV